MARSCGVRAALTCELSGSSPFHLMGALTEILWTKGITFNIPGSRTKLGLPIQYIELPNYRLPNGNAHTFL